jgi:lipopolysaccharide transport system ATP-binding protein
MMLRSRSMHPAYDLPDDVLVSVQGVTRAIAAPSPELPQWLARVLPKSGLAGGGSLGPDVDMEDSVDEEVDLEVDEEEEPQALKEISFELRRGEGIGILGDQKARRTLFRILTGAIPPTSGVVLVRGRIAPVLKNDLMKLTSTETGERAVFMAARFLHWPRPVLRRRWAEILEFAMLDELAGMEPRKYAPALTRRLLLSTALHLDSDVFILDESLETDPAFAVRCLELLEQRQREGAAVIQGGFKMVENLARLCGEVLWLMNGAVLERGRPVDVAVATEKVRKEELHVLSAPLLASLADSGPVDVPSEGATVDIELHVLRRSLDITFTLLLKDWNGREQQFAQPEGVRPADPGLYRLGIFIPGGLLSDGTYEAKLVAEVGVTGSKAGPPRDLLMFEIVSTGQEEAEAGDEGLTFELVLDSDEIGETAEDVEWRVSRSHS